MSVGFRLTALGHGNALLEPTAALNPAKPDELVGAVLGELLNKRISLLYFDLGAIPVIDRTYYDALNHLATACKTVNVRMICFNMQPAAAYALATLLEEPPLFETSVGMPEE